MTRRHLGIAVNGATDRLGCWQHLQRGLMPLRRDGGVLLPEGDVLVPEPVLLGTDPVRLRAVAQYLGGLRWTTETDTALSDPAIEVYFDCQTGGQSSVRLDALLADIPDDVYHAVLTDQHAASRRADALRAAVAAGKHVYSELPAAPDPQTALQLSRYAQQNDVVSGLVVEKLAMPGILALRQLVEEEFFGRILSVRCEFGLWVDPSPEHGARWPDYKFRTEEGGGIIPGAVLHWHYLLETLFGRVTAVTCRATTHFPQRNDTQGRAREATAEDAAYVLFDLDNGVIAQVNFSWCSRIHRDELTEFHVDGTAGSAVAGLRHCRVQRDGEGPVTVWNPDRPDPNRYRNRWRPVPVPATTDSTTAYQRQWGSFLCHAATGKPYPYGLELSAGAQQLVEVTLRSAAENRRLIVSPVL